MTDKEIIQALECCKKDDCDNCPNDFGNCYANLSGYSLDIINRQQAEIERLRKEVNLVSIQFQDAQERYEEVQTEIERLNNIKFGVDLSIGSIKTEVIKEFADRLLDKARAVQIGNLTWVWLISQDDINDTIKETVGEKYERI